MAGAIINGSNHFYTIVYEGTGTGQRVGKFIPFTDQSTLDKSLIFNVGDGPKLSRTNSSGGNRRTFTISAWVKRSNMGQNSYIFFAGESGNAYSRLWLDSSDLKLHFHSTNSAGSNRMSISTTRTFEDKSRFYHIVVAVDTTQGTNSNKIKLYVDGEQITAFSYESYDGGTNYDTEVNKANSVHYWGQAGHYASQGLEGYLAQAIFVDGTAYGPDTFGITDTSTGNWIPKTLGSITYGTNGSRLDFANTAGQTFGDDTSGQGNDYTVTNLTSGDLTTDTPTKNFAILDPSRSKSGFTFTEGNRKLATGDNTGLAFSTMRVYGTKFYFEAKLTAFTSGGGPSFGLAPEDTVVTTDPGSPGDGEGNKLMGYYSNGTDSAILYRGQYYNDSGNGASVNDWVQMAFDGTDRSNQKVYIGRNNTFYYEDASKGSFNAAKPTFTFDGNNQPSVRLYLSNRRSTGTSSGASTWENINFGTHSYNYTAPTGFGSLNQDTMTEVDEGKGDLVWVKNRDNGSRGHQLYDSSRGPLKTIYSNGTNAESTNDDSLQKFLKGGFAAEDFTGFNEAGESHVAWNWVANGGTTSANTDGSGATLASTIQANQTAGFSIVTYTGSGSNALVAHGLSSAPEWVLIKERSNSNSWINSHVGLTSQATYSLTLNNTNAEYSDAGTVFWNNAAPTNKVVSLDTDTGVNGSSRTYVMYCWHSVPGFSKFGSYTGNGNVDGPFIYTGFKPSFLIVKNRQRATGWYMYDNKRTPFNEMDGHMFPGATTAETTGSEEVDFLSNGIKFRGDNSGSNRSGEVFVYMAFAEHPFVGDGTNPSTAR
jgi:hypothetical protein